MASAAALQAHYDEIQANMPVLPLAAAPKSYASLDLPALDPLNHNKVSHVLSKAAAGLKQCQICSRSSSADSLGYHISSQVDFHTRTVRAVAGQFACSLCRAVSSPSLLLEVATPALGSEDYGRSETLQQLFLHFAAVNSAPASITGNPEALAVWMQELACRAYSMQVVASSLRGWKLVGPTGQLVQQGTAGAGLELVQQLLQAQTQGGAALKAAAGGSETAAAGAIGSHAGMKSSKKQRRQPAVTGLGQQSLQPAAQMTVKRKALQSAQQPALQVSKKAKKNSVTAVTETPNQQHHQQQQQQLLQKPAALQQDITTAQNKAKKHKQKVPTPSKITSAEGTAAAAIKKQQQSAAAFNTPQVTKMKRQGTAGKKRLSLPS